MRGQKTPPSQVPGLGVVEVEKGPLLLLRRERISTGLLGGAALEPLPISAGIKGPVISTLH